ncbi:MAG: hypothetical protein GC193_14100 [Cryomorphaceae bacterium]|nr:hypothetical protein [Cryomorphaceae bacterium]
MGKSFALMLAWPETKCKQAGGWYDSLMRIMRLNEEGYYRVGHAAVVLINKDNGACRYFDFGRYHSPKGFGRVRSDYTDHELKLETSVRFASDHEPKNIAELLSELQNKKACHGDGKLYAGIIEVNFDLAEQRAKNMQEKIFIQYGPFVRSGSNCSRFVRQVVLAGAVPGICKIGLKYPMMITPTPRWNVRMGEGQLERLLKQYEDENLKLA